MSDGMGETGRANGQKLSRAVRKPLGPMHRTDSGNIIGSRLGVVETDQRDKTRKVIISYKAPHPKYGKFVSRRTVLHVHDETNESHKGDIVEVAPCRPVSKTKSWRLVRVVERRSQIG